MIGSQKKMVDHLAEGRGHLSALPPPGVVRRVRLINDVSMGDGSTIIPRPACSHVSGVMCRVLNDWRLRGFSPKAARRTPAFSLLCRRTRRLF